MDQRTREIKLLDAVALLEDHPERKLKRGEVGTVVEILAPHVYEVEFSDDDGQTYAELALRGDQLVVLHGSARPTGSPRPGDRAAQRQEPSRRGRRDDSNGSGTPYRFRGGTSRRLPGRRRK